MQLKLPRPSRLLSQGSPPHAPETASADDPWAGEDVEWEAEDAPRGRPPAFVGFFRAVLVGALVGGLFWGAVVYLILRLL